jgi:hypothetical protein
MADDPEEEPPICGKPMVPFWRRGREPAPPPTDEVRQVIPFRPEPIIEIYTFCLLPPDHVGDCMDAKVTTPLDNN